MKIKNSWLFELIGINTKIQRGTNTSNLIKSGGSINYTPQGQQPETQIGRRQGSILFNNLSPLEKNIKKNNMLKYKKLRLARAMQAKLRSRNNFPKGIN